MATARKKVLQRNICSPFLVSMQRDHTFNHCIMKERRSNRSRMKNRASLSGAAGSWQSLLRGIGGQRHWFFFVLCSPAARDAFSLSETPARLPRSIVSWYLPVASICVRFETPCVNTPLRMTVFPTFISLAFHFGPCKCRAPCGVPMRRSRPWPLFGTARLTKYAV